MTIVDERPFSVGVDIGGTHTDLIVATPEGLVRSKAFTTHEDYSRGVFAALTGAAEKIGVTTDDLVSRCAAFVNSSTVVTNALTELRGAKVGVLITRGFKDTFRIAGGARKADYDEYVQTTPPEIVNRDCIEEISERVTTGGEVAVGLAEDEVRAAARRLRSKGVEAVAVCYLWSFAQPEHERRTREILSEEFADVFVTLSSEIHPVVRETERFMTAVFNCLSHRATTRFVDQIGGQLRSAGLTGALSFFQGIGGSVSGDAVKDRPLTLLASGPAGGVMGARYSARQLGFTDILVGDMGGTSFDTSLLHDMEPAIAKRISLGQLPTGVDIVDVVSVGAGGGSIAWLDSRGVPQVGPRSAGSEPGPACYGKGGEEPTVTDANLVLGLIDPANYLHGKHRLDVESARAVIEEVLADPLGWSVEQAAAGVYELAVVGMADALRTVSVERGHDPRTFTFFAYGGGLGLFAVEVARRLGCGTVVIPDDSSAFSARGVLIVDYVRQYSRTVNWILRDETGVDAVNAVISEVRAQAVRDAEQDGLTPDDLEVQVTGDCCFAGQVWEIPVALPDRPLTAADGAELAESFPSTYERAYGEGTAWVDSPAVLVTVSVKAVHERVKPATRESEPVAVEPEPAGQRSIVLPDERRREEVGVYADADLVPGAVISGPCIVDVGDTTIYVPKGADCRRDRFYTSSSTPEEFGRD